MFGHKRMLVPLEIGSKTMKLIGKILYYRPDSITYFDEINTIMFDEHKDWPGGAPNGIDFLINGQAVDHYPYQVDIEKSMDAINSVIKDSIQYNVIGTLTREICFVPKG